ncbi:MAG: amidohydrolase family protein [Acidobacteria bacterium]|nr:amidohydrolase family protein [Acidobacteriota bacterium]
MRTKLILVLCAVFCIAFSSSAYGQSYAITNARIVTVSGPAIEKGTIVVREGLIFAVGANVAVPADAIVFDGTGMTVYPGFIDAVSNLGMPAAPQRPAGPGGGAAAAAAAAAAQQAPTSNSNYPAGLRPEDMAADDLRAGDGQFEAARAAGFTTALVTGRSGIFNGQSAVINLAGDNVSGMIVRSPLAHHISFATIPGGYPGSLMGTFSALRQMFLDAQRQMEIEKLYEANPAGIRRPAADRSLSALYPALNRQMPVVFNAVTEREIVRALDFIREFNLRGIIAGGHEAGSVVDRLKAQNVPVIFSLNLPRRTTSAAADADPETLMTLRMREAVPKAPAALNNAGVKFAFQSGGLQSLTDFFANAAKTTENGLSKEAAIRAMTLGAAEILGVDKQLGSIEVGKIANLAVVKGDVFARDRFVSRVMVDGKVFEFKEQPRPPQGGPRGPGGPGGNPGGGAGGPGGPSVAGTYNITINIPGQPLPATLTITQQGNTVSGTMTSQLGTTAMTGNMSASGFSMSGGIEFGGSSITIVMQGSVAGSQISGNIDSPQGQIPFTGTRNP